MSVLYKLLQPKLENKENGKKIIYPRVVRAGNDEEETNKPDTGRDDRGESPDSTF